METTMPFSEHTHTHTPYTFGIKLFIKYDNNAYIWSHFYTFGHIFTHLVTFLHLWDQVVLL